MLTFDVVVHCPFSCNIILNLIWGFGVLIAKHLPAELQEVNYDL